MHFTYNEKPNTDSLFQGDVLSISGEIRTVLENYHPYFLRNEYKYFIVLTQSCDLQRRNGIKCRSPYITLAAVRSYEDFIYKKALDFDVIDINGIKLLDDQNFENFWKLIERVYNNNESEHFFLAKDSSMEFFENMVAFLKVSIALKSEEHYKKCLDAKVLELGDDFKAKLGWLVGDMYSRVGTTDWECIKKREELLDIYKGDLKSRFMVNSRKKLTSLKDQIATQNLSFDDPESLLDYLDSMIIEKKYDVVMNIIQQTIEGSKKLGTDTERVALVREIRNNPRIRNAIKG